MCWNAVRSEEERRSNRFNHGMDAMTSFRYRCTRNDNFKGLKDLKPLQLPLVYTTVVPKGECQPDLTARIPR
ncbi:MAG: hypothetical protein HC862_18365 [Scytonema sp. RU_4_4]|nr:hypothetical protein [Scytonema sp. RU_4_4]